MPIFRNSRNSTGNSLAELDGESLRLEQEQREYVRMLRQGICDAADPSLLPPPEKMHTRRCCTTMPRHQKRCEQQFQAAALLLFIVLSVATVAVVITMLRLAQM